MNTQVQNIELEQIQDLQTPKFSKAHIEQIAKELKQQSIKRVILLKSIGANLYEICFGAELYFAAQSLGMKSIPALIED